MLPQRKETAADIMGIHFDGLFTIGGVRPRHYRLKHVKIDYDH